MKIASKLLIAAFLAVAPPLSAQESERPELDGRRISVNLFRAPSTGVDYRLGTSTSAHAGFYPTVLSIDGQRNVVSFIRLGATFWMKPQGSGFYASTGVALSLKRGTWGDSFANEVGYHQQLGSRWGARLGGLLLTTVDLRRSRINPTVGLSFRPGARRIP